jgi:diketogulonate reductase-like aldo/keto reductase
VTANRRRSKVTPAVNQIRLHPYNLKEQAATLAYCAARGIQVAAYSALTPLTRAPGGPVDAPVRAAADARGATPAQVLLLWARAKGAALVTTSSRKERLQEYLAAGDLPPLTLAEVAAIDAAGALGPPKSIKWEWAGRAVAAVVLGAYGAWSLGYL